ncbi:chemotaxis protein MotD [Pseudorhizobium tarimense]|uniref:Chemotaxis protein MotD n=1 Tax=Pseudorhizobium tarimense TaxID=1079109 RepID=A0ABV2HAQ5_9HYPH|nr:flagellar hook-length control protein FliK [Pseudorhizobium tarimense]MCJ8520845.1 flagellar hook-length control protein FliK [Pseudorhizobium tarimense]
MTLEVLARTAPTETQVKGSGRAAGENGEANGFSSALSNAGRGASEEKAAEGHRWSAQDAQGDESRLTDAPVRYSIKAVLIDTGEAALQGQVMQGQVMQGKAAQAQDVSQAKTPAIEKHGAPRKGGSEEADGSDAPKAAEEGDGTTAPATAEAHQGAADLLAILAGQRAASNATSAPQSGNAAEGRKTSEGSGGERSAKASSEVAAVARGQDLPIDVLDMPTADDPGAGNDRNLRFINAKNGSLNAELAMAAQSRDAAGAESKTGTSQTDTVMVLDSRRFIGMQTSSNGASLMAAMVGDQAWSAAMQPDATLSNIASQGSSGSVMHMLKLQMTPHDLGTVTATLKMSGEQLHVHLTVESRAAHRQLSEDSSGMLDALRSQGFSVDQVTISIAPSTESDAQKGQQGAQAGQQQAPGNGERQGSTNRDQSGTRFSDIADDRNTDNDASLDILPASGPGGAGGPSAGQLYL